MLHLPLLATIALIGYVTLTLWSHIRETVTSWLHANNLQASSITSGWIRVDRVASKVRGKLKLTTPQTGKVTIVLDREFSLRQIEDPELRAELEKRGTARMDIAHLIS